MDDSEADRRAQDAATTIAQGPPVEGEADAPAAPVWRFEQATRAHPVVDAGPYFALMRDAMVGAKQRILLIGWDFDTRVDLRTGRRWWNLPRKDVPPARLGPFMVWLARRNPNLEIRVLRWNFGALKALFRGRMVFDLIRWKFHKQIIFKLDSAHPLGCSHHQKIVVIDDKFAACGGIDMTNGRWDTRDHLEDDPRRKGPMGGPFAPWHDCAMLMEGPVAKALGDYGRTRWKEAGGGEIEPCKPTDESCWPERLKPAFTQVDIGIARTRSQYNAAPALREIESLFLNQIARAKRFLYVENQYFASRTIAEAIALRLVEPDPPEICIVTPLEADGWLQQATMDAARVRLFNAVKEKDHAGRFSMWYPVNAAGTPIYVHSKLLIVDDEVLRIGSANFNNRSMGLDSECDVFVDAAREGSESAAAQITRLRLSLIGEHTGMSAHDAAAALEQAGSMGAMIAAAPQDGKRLVAFVPRELSDTERAIADSEALDPERPEEMLKFYSPGLFRGRILRRPRA